MAFPSRIIVTEAGRKSLQKLTPEARLRILRKLAEYNDKPELISLNVKQFVDTKQPQLRLRVGDYRAIGTVDGDTLLLHVFIDRKNL